MAKTKYYIELDDFERAVLTRIVCEQKESERTIMRAKILLMSDVTQPEKLSRNSQRCLEQQTQRYRQCGQNMQKRDLKVRSIESREQFTMV